MSTWNFSQFKELSTFVFEIKGGMHESFLTFHVVFSLFAVLYNLNWWFATVVVLKHFLLVSQVGIIMYLPTMDARQRKEITEEFFHYRHLTQVELWDKYSAYEHWAKIEVLINIWHLIFCSSFRLSSTELVLCSTVGIKRKWKRSSPIDFLLYHHSDSIKNWFLKWAKWCSIEIWCFFI